MRHTAIFTNIHPMVTGHLGVQGVAPSSETWATLADYEKMQNVFFSASMNQDLSFNKTPWWFAYTLKFEKHCCKIPFLNLIRRKPYLFLFELSAIQLLRLNFSFHLFLIHSLALLKNTAHFHPLPVLKLGLFSQMFEYKKILMGLKRDMNYEI